MKMLVVDDSQVIRKLMRAVADALKIEIEEARDGVEALQKLKEIYRETSLVLLDWNMPKKSGYDVLSEIKSHEDYRNIPVMMVTAESQKSSIVAAIRAGASNYLTKPFTVEELQSKIIECIGEEDE